jgi:hypothetical protein
MISSHRFPGNNSRNNVPSGSILAEHYFPQLLPEAITPYFLRISCKKKRLPVEIRAI